MYSSIRFRPVAQQPGEIEIEMSRFGASRRLYYKVSFARAFNAQVGMLLTEVKELIIGHALRNRAEAQRQCVGRSVIKNWVHQLRKQRSNAAIGRRCCGFTWLIFVMITTSPEMSRTLT
jgi:hypothetical protein